ncbi:MAG: hypothetical protein U1G07_07570 [Verrucomicrobiota bacterium]
MNNHNLGYLKTRAAAGRLHGAKLLLTASLWLLAGLLAGRTAAGGELPSIEDTIPPVPPTLEPVTGECSVTLTTPTAEDESAGTIVGTTTDPLTYSTEGTFIVHWTFDDGHGNTSTANQTVIVDDTTAPVPPILAPVTAECSVTLTAPTAEDACAGVIVGTTTDRLTYSTADHSTAEGIFIVHWTFDDGHGNTSSAEQSVILDDTLAPVPPTLSDVKWDCLPALLSVPVAIDDCVGLVGGQHSTPDGALYEPGVYLIHWTFNDGHGNTSSADQTYTVLDDTPPIPFDAPTLTGQCSVTINPWMIELNALAHDNCQPERVVGTTSDPLTYSTQGTFIIHWNYRDWSGNTSSNEQTIIVKDTRAPVAPTLSPVTNQCNATLTAPTAEDECAGTIVGTTSDPRTYPTPGTFLVHWIFDDGHGNTSTTDQAVVIQDTAAPVPPVLAPVTAECSVTLTPPTAEDESAGTIVGTTSDPLTYSREGTFIVHWTFDDGHGNTSTADQTVIIDDTIAPVPPVLAPVTNRCFTPLAVPKAEDACAGAIEGTTTDPLTYANRGQGTFIVHWTFDDGHGNASSAEQTVIVAKVLSATNLAPQETYIEDTPLDLGDIVIDGSPGETVIAILQVSPPILSLLSTATAGGATSSYLPAAGYWVVTGTVADVNTLLAGLTFREMPNFHTDVTIDIRLVDACGTELLASRKTITAIAVNDAPSFQKGLNQTATAGAGTRTVSNWATLISSGPADESGQTLAFDVSNNNNRLFSVQPALSADGTLSFTPAANASGDATVTVVLRDNGGTSHNGLDTSPSQTFVITVLPAPNNPPQVTGSPANLTIQYSDPIPSTLLTANDPDSSGATLAVAFSWKTNGAAFTPGLPPGLSAAQSSTTANARVWTLSGLPSLRPGTYTLHGSVTDASNNVASLELPLNILPEDARATYTGDGFVTTSSSSATTAKVNLSVTVQDISAVAGDPAIDNYPGDIRNARVSFINRDDSTVIAANLPVTLLNSSDKKTGTASYSWTVNLGSADFLTYNVGVIVTDCYTADSAAEDTLVTVARPATSKFVIGAGNLVLSRPAGLAAALSNSRTDFGLAALSRSSGVVGVMRVIVRAKDRVCYLDSLSMSSLVFDKKKATLTGKGRITTLIGKNRQVLDNNASFQIKMSDNGLFIPRDTIAITIWNSAGALWFASNWDGAKAIEQTLAQGELLVLTSLSGLLSESSPGKAGPALSLTRSSTAPGGLELIFPAQSVSAYVLEATTDLIYWTPVHPFTAQEDGTMVLELQTSEQPAKFYRLVGESEAKR